MSLQTSRWRAWGIVLAISALMPAVLSAQPASAGEGEVAVFGGGSFGMGSHAVVGGSTGVAFSRYLMALIEASYQPLGDQTIQSGPSSSSITSSGLWDFDLNMHIRIPIKRKWEPYGIGGVGLLWNHIHQNVGTTQGNVFSRTLDQYNAAFHTGGGVRYYVGDSWGVRPEVQVIVSQRTYVRMSVGIFYELGSGL